MLQNLKKVGRAVVDYCAGSVAKVAAVGAGTLVAAQSSFAVGLDLTTITAAVDIGTVVTGIVAMGAIMILPNVAKWATKKLATFF